MKLGDQGDAILALNRLLSFALEQPINSSDLFSKETEQQVKEFQEIFDLKTDGIVGSSTQMWLDTIVNVDAPLLQGGE
jgi:general secretion pathway protein A